MKIVFIGGAPNFNAEFYYSRAFQCLGHEVICVNQYSGANTGTLSRFAVTRFQGMRWWAERAAINGSIVSELSRISPDFVLVFKGEFLTTRVISAICNNFSTYLLYPDSFRFLPALRARIGFFDALFVSGRNTVFYRRLGAKRVLTVPWGCDPEIHRPIACEKRYAVTFVGTPYLNRYVALRGLPQLHVFGNWWFICPGQRHSSVVGPDYVRVINQSKVNLNIHHPTNHQADDLNMRAFEVLSSGGFLLCDFLPMAVDLFPSLVTYRDHAQLRDLNQYYLDHGPERQEIADSNSEVCRKKHTYLHRAELILSTVH